MSGFTDNIPLNDQIKNLKYRWSAATSKYIRYYPDFKLGLDRSQYNRALAQLRSVYNEINVLNANLNGNISQNDKNLKDKSTKITNIKTTYASKKGELTSKLGENKAAMPFKIQKYDENSQSYIFSTGYTIGIFTLLFFIYKQINLE